MDKENINEVKNDRSQDEMNNTSKEDFSKRFQIVYSTKPLLVNEGKEYEAEMASFVDFLVENDQTLQKPYIGTPQRSKSPTILTETKMKAPENAANSVDIEFEYEDECNLELCRNVTSDVDEINSRERPMQSSIARQTMPCERLQKLNEALHKLEQNLR